MQGKISAGVISAGIRKDQLLYHRRGIKRIVPSPITSTNHKYRRPNNPSQGPESISDIRPCNPPTQESRQGARVQYDRAQETRTTPRNRHSAAERRPVRYRQTLCMLSTEPLKATVDL
ncbi:uncharacterized protein TNCV_812691 [Trichonephila clavipes]|nr:uncharacterized protein TNCV_812691 [Trichonephila clavipes]